MRWVALLVVLAGCQAGGSVRGIQLTGSATPVVEAVGGSATLEITACPTAQGIAQIQQLLSVLSASSVVVAAQGEGSARLVVDLCPGGMHGPI
jgi:hypothetical protein